MFDMMAMGFANVLNPTCLLLILGGVTVGIVFGAIPGLSASMAVALCLPMTFGMDPIHGMTLLVSLYIGGISGGLISSILLKIPGTPSSIATTFDGHPMAERGETGKALGTGILFSFIGGLIGILILIFIAPTVAKFALKFGPFEYCAVSIFSLTLIAGLISGSVVKGLISALLGIAFGTFGTAPLDATSRFTFGINELKGGFQLVPVLIGLFAVTEILKTAEESLLPNKSEMIDFKRTKGFGLTLSEISGQFVNAVRSAFIGIGIGILPGIGGGTSNIIAYLAAKNSSKHPEKFGTGIVDGIVASETANNATIGGALVPLLTLGIPGDGSTAILLGALTIHGLMPGPMFFQTEDNCG